MTYNPNRDSGYRKVKTSMHIPSADFASIVQGSELQPLNERYYADLVYQINSAPITISGDVQVDTNYMESLLENVYSELVELNINDNSSRVIQTFGTDDYIAHAPRGSDINASVWRVQKLDVDGSRQWADTGNFSQPASGDLSGLVFTY